MAAARAARPGYAVRRGWRARVRAGGGPAPPAAGASGGDDHRTDGGWPEILAVGEKLLFRVQRTEEDGVWSITTEGYPLSEMEPPTVSERLASSMTGRELRQRAWAFSHNDFTFLLSTEEGVDADAPGPDERFARALAEALGWALPPNGSTSWRPM